MKRILIIAMLFISVTATFAQTGGEWFNQKKTQKKYLLAQIAALRYYIDVAQKGYGIAKQGLSTIGKLSKGEFDLHGEYFSSLKKVNPTVKKYAKVADIISLQAKIVQDYHSFYNGIASEDILTAREMDYLERVFSRLLDDCSVILDQLIAVTTDNQLEMKDDERMEKIDQLYLAMKDNYVFSKSFGNSTRVVIVARKKEINDVKTARNIQGINGQQP